MKKDIRWRQRFNNYKKALNKLSNAVEFVSDDKNLFNETISEISYEGLIQCFEFTIELAWNVMKDYLHDDGVKNISGSRDAVRNSFNRGLIDDGQTWLDMIEGRNIISHTYDEKTAELLVRDIVGIYYSLFTRFREKMESLI
ncbi:MAG: nucleotidyltransferase substrate binding protein [Chitinispirillales bacterium]|jgi:nucleotidyltransferase substrate binding protein (TIGR01987 family)|nr:nucleotidyltransferase substrate binding protein [Chitinispirillales bacterium]